MTKELEVKLLMLVDTFKPLSMTQDELDGWYTSVKTVRDQRTDFTEAWQNTLSAIDEDQATSIRNFLKIYESDKVDIVTTTEKPSTPQHNNITDQPTPQPPQQTRQEILEALRGSIQHQTQVINDLLEQDATAPHTTSNELHELRVQHIRQIEEVFTATISLIDNELTNQRSDLKKLVQNRLDTLIQNLA